MRLTVNENSKIVSIWLTKAEQNDAELRESLKPLYKEYHNQKYTVAVFMSGEQDLYENTRDLLLYNRRRSAERKCRQKKPPQCPCGCEHQGGGNASPQIFYFKIPLQFPNA